MTLAQYYDTVRTATQDICQPLQTEDYVPQPVPFVSPPKWHLAHSTWFFEEFILKKYLPGYVVFDEDFGFLFNSYYNNVGNRVFRANRGNITRPNVAQVYEYRQYVDAHMQELIQAKADDAALAGLIVLGLNHEQQHQELLVTDIKYILGGNPLFPVYDEVADWEAQHNTGTGFVTIDEGVYNVGHEGAGFSFDNEHGRHKVYLNQFTISNTLVTNAQYLEFINAGGYTNFNYWLDEGWSWVTENKIEAPLYWYIIDRQWMHYTLSGLKPVDPDAMLTHVSFYEAAAFAEWKRMRLPTEFEWEIASAQLNWGKRWEWTHSAYLPYPNFHKPDGALGEYNGKFMVNQMVLRGASCATPKGHSRNTYRNFFHAGERWQFTGIRLVKL
ncbi:ergothioneine biosynthesis protein EgtB [Flavobacterium subsaxonicum]|uniref:Sulfatase maturase n=1 Tax=Flavobacterium subsaxonicum WB 4.1-42 = DSM 21790 TaxID=1121898 RepID=A0A0A2MJL5_9FLAO|nr:ergothioneine biosynthesis protein EgtB [Flavobacterium subsaxonicum]KGO91766.1 sulfatase maturase [Flavobacterium subsaxonicum WB 4.1-42 = DSM 21790]